MSCIKPKSFYLLNLGCSKNLVEGEHLAGQLIYSGWEPLSEPGLAQAIIVNTCGFIQPAVEESLDEILELAQEKSQGQILCVAGCLVGRYGAKLSEGLHEADLFVGPGMMHRLGELLADHQNHRLAMGRPDRIYTSRDPRAVATGPGWAYLRVADGCSHRCGFCTIPMIRGSLRSRRPSDIFAEARALAVSGVREINLVAQDLTSYGKDLEAGVNLANLLKGLNKINELSWIRLLYLHPDILDETLLEAIFSYDKVLPYFDLPVQHVAAPVLEKMGRKKRKKDILNIIETIRTHRPEATLRATVMTGHPGEGPNEYLELLDFVKQARFDHLGCFGFQPESGTKSAAMDYPEPELVSHRFNEIMSCQQQISLEKLTEHVGRVEEVLVLGPHPESELIWYGRLKSQAPDEIDGHAIITEGNATPGDIVLCKVEKAHAYDLEVSIL